MNLKTTNQFKFYENFQKYWKKYFIYGYMKIQVIVPQSVWP